SFPAFKTDRIKPGLQEQFKLGIHGLGANVFGQLANNFDIILLSYFLVNQSEVLGQYSFAAIFITALGIIQGTVVNIATPYFSKHVGNIKVIKQLYRKYTFILLIGMLALLLILYILLPMFIDFVYQDRFQLG